MMKMRLSVSKKLYQKLLVSLGLVACVSMAGCDQVKRTMGITRPKTDPYLVLGEDLPLVVPPGIHERPLPQPKPGASRPQKRSSTDTARQILSGESSSDTGDQDVVITPPKNSGASVLIEQAQSGLNTSSASGQTNLPRK